MTLITGSGIAKFQIAVVKRAIRAWLDHGVKVNTAYTPKNMRLTAEKICGKKFKNLEEAYDGLVEMEQL